MHRKYSIFRLSTLANAILFINVLPSTSFAAEIVVNSSEDLGEAAITLNEALTIAAADEEADTITFSTDLSNSVLNLYSHIHGASSGDLTIDAEGVAGLTLNIKDVGTTALASESNKLHIKNVNLILEPDAFTNESDTFISISNSELTLENVNLNGTSPINLGRPRIGISAIDSDVRLIDSSISGMFSKGSAGMAIDFLNESSEQKDLYLYNTNIINNGVALADSAYSTVSVNSAYSNIEIRDSTFSGNYTQAGTAGIEIISVVNNLDVVILNSVFNNNTASDVEFGVGALKILTQLNEDDGELSLRIKNSRFSSNEGGKTSNIDINTYQLAQMNVDILNSSFSDSTSENANIYFSNYGNEDSTFNIVHSTIVNNLIDSETPESPKHSGVNLLNNIDPEADEISKLNIYNSIISGNQQAIWDELEEIYVITGGDLYLQGIVDADLSHSLIKVINLDDEAKENSPVKKRDLVENKNPKLAGDEFDLFDVPTICLSENSPARNTGEASYTQQFKLKKDLTDNNRLFDEAPDMGAVEYQSCNPTLDELDDLAEYPLRKKTKGQLGWLLLLPLALISASRRFKF